MQESSTRAHRIAPGSKEKLEKQEVATMEQFEGALHGPNWNDSGNKISKGVLKYKSKYKINRTRHLCKYITD